jgi:hypothetical protein
VPIGPLETEMIRRTLSSAQPPVDRSYVNGIRPGQVSPELGESAAPWDRIQLGMEHMKAQMPEEYAYAGEPKPMNPLLRWLGNAAGMELDASTGPFGGIQYNPENIPQTQAGVDDMLAHELVHVRQMKKMGLLEKAQNSVANMLTPYRNRPMEQEAYGNELRRQQMRQDIQLPKE